MKKIGNIEIPAPSEVKQTEQQAVVWDCFLRPIYEQLYNDLNSQADALMQLDADNYVLLIKQLCQYLDKNTNLAVRKCAIKTIALKAFEANLHQKGLIAFTSQFPFFALQLKNIHLSADITLSAIELYLGQNLTHNNFIEIKKQTDRLNRIGWSRQQTHSEEQSGVSNLGTMSELLLEKALGGLLDEQHLFKTTNQEIQSYGDFVLMCLPNNLWLSVKSNYARERLLASGYTTDIIGVGFFTDKDEFTSRSKIRNFQRVGFLAMYLPDVAITQTQLQHKTDTYQQVCDDYQQKNLIMPKNINGTAFLRPLSQLFEDLEKMLTVKELKNRTTINF